MTEVSVYETGNLLQEEISFLEKLFHDLQTEQSASEQEVRMNINKLTKKKNDLEMKLKRFSHIAPERQQKVILDEDFFDALVRREKETEDLEETARDEAAKAKTRKEVANERWEGTKKQLKEAGHGEPLSFNEIKRNYQDRLVHIAEQKKALLLETEEQEQKQKRYQRKQNAIDRAVEPPAET